MDNKKTVISGAKWMTISTLVSSLVIILRLSILAHFLEKSDFGVVAILTFIHGLTIMFSDMGFATVVLYKQDLKKKEFSSLFWIQMLVYATLYLLVIGFSHPIAVFYNEPLLHILVPLSLIDLFFTAFGKLYEAVLQKNFQFRVIALRNITSSILSLVLAVLMAVAGCGVYTLVFSTLFGSLFLSVWNFTVGQKHIKLRFHCSLKEVQPLVKIGLYQTGTSIVDYLCSKLDVLIIGKLLGMEALGVYNLSKELIYRFIQSINSIVNKVMSPVFSKMQGDVDKLRDGYCATLLKLTCLTFAALTFIAALSTQIIGVLYGESYQEAGLLTALLSCVAMGTAVGNPVTSIIVASGRTDLSFKFVWIRAIYTVPCVYLCALYSIQTVAVGQIVLMTLDYVFQSIIEVKPVLNITLRKLTSTFYKQGIISLIIGTLGYVVLSLNPLNINLPIFQLVVYALVIIVIYITTFVLLLRNEFYSMISLIKSFK